MAFHFFTEPLKLQNQTELQAFGVIDDDNYRLGNMFTANSSETPKAFAVTDGLVLVQKIVENGNPIDKYNIILKPTQQPDLNLPKIDYIIYKGIKKDSLVTGSKVATPSSDLSKDHLIRTIHENTAQWHSEAGTPIPNTEPNAFRSLGLIYNSISTDYPTSNNNSLNSVFFANNNVILPFVFSGNHIGNFDTSTDFGIEIIFEKIGFEPKFNLARELDSKLIFNPLTGGETNAEAFDRKHDKETILAFLDSTSFFGAFYNIGLNVFNGTEFEIKQKDILYNDVILKHFNKNKIYLDIRNEYNDSFNYYQNYVNEIFLGLDGTESTSSIIYYQNTWPILQLKDTDFDGGNTNKIIKISLPIGDNNYPILFLQCAYREDLGTNDLTRKMDSFITLYSESNSLYSSDQKIIAIKNSTNQIISNYYQLKYIKKYNRPNDVLIGLSLNKLSILDNLFPLFDLKTPFSDTNATNIKIYYDITYIDKSDINESDFISNVGIANDTQYVSFISFPNTYNKNKSNFNDIIPLSTGQYFNDKSFIENLNTNVAQKTIKLGTFTDNNGNKPFLTFEKDETAENQLSNYDFDNVNIITITVAQFQQLETLRTTHFDPKYKVYLGITNTNYLIHDNEKFSTNKFVLRGLKNNSGIIETVEVVTNLEVFAEDRLYN